MILPSVYGLADRRYSSEHRTNNMETLTLLTLSLALLLVPCEADSGPCLPAKVNVTYGPAAGGTVIGLQLNNKQTASDVSWCGVCTTWETNCQATSANWNNETLVMTTPPYPHYPGNGTDLVNICCFLSSSCDSSGCQNVANFTYMPNPMIMTPTSTTNMTSTVMGGIQQMINGVNLDSVACPKLIVHAMNGSYEMPTVYPWSCPPNKGNDTLVTLYTPNVNFTKNLAPANYSQVVNNDTFSFYVDIIFDGINVTGIPLTVYQEPYLVPLTPLMPFVANENNVITIQGADLIGTGFSQSDVTVNVGDPSVMTNGIVCSNVTVTETTIVCEPPPLEAMDIMYPPSSGPNPAQPNVTVIIGLGGYQFQANQLQYTLNEPFNVIMIIMIAVLGFVVVMSLFFVALTCCGVGRRPATLLEAVPKKYTALSSDSMSTKSRQSLSSGAGTSSSDHRSVKSKSVTITKKSASETGLSESSIEVKVVRKSEFDNEAYEKL